MSRRWMQMRTEHLEVRLNQIQDDIRLQALPFLHRRCVSVDLSLLHWVWLPPADSSITCSILAIITPVAAFARSQ
eukprot:scaffold233204_cov15-Prasinocladus_malaysianus.AAC.1